MNWFDKIKSLTTKDDNSPELKQGEIKQLLLDQAAISAPDFIFLDYKNRCYSFQRLKEFKGLTVYETLHIMFGLSDRNFSCSVASRLNPLYINSTEYNGGLINPNVSLIALKTGNGTTPIEDAYYFHNGRVKTTTKVVEQIFNDFKSVGIQFLNYQFQRLNNNILINEGLEFIAKLKHDKEVIQRERESELKNGGQLISSIRHPIYIQLKESLQSIPAQTREDRKEIPMLAFELLGIYWTTKKSDT